MLLVRWSAMGAALALALVAVAGCGGDRYAEVSGVISLNGAPLDGATVTFFPEKGTPVAGFAEVGRYRILDVPWGVNRITVTPKQEEPQVTAGAGRPLKPGEVDPTARAAPAAKKAPTLALGKYLDVDKSNLKCKVDKQKMDHPIVLD